MVEKPIPLILKGYVRGGRSQEGNNKPIFTWKDDFSVFSKLYLYRLDWHYVRNEVVCVLSLQYNSYLSITIKYSFCHHCINQPMLLRTGLVYFGAMFYCPHAIADGNSCIPIMEKMLVFTLVILPMRPLHVPKNHIGLGHLLCLCYL